ncbi:MAG: hypothetical protein H7Y17_08035 [Chlorobia bacterium]|nr:hypothetical protein [Fimbriimonadaceae bacterium]
MLTLLVAAIATQAQAPIVPVARPGIDGRGRDPWVFRGIFEDRTRMLILAPAPNWWMAFNPETGAMHKVWRGKMDFRGKVWDFSQNNSRADGQVFHSSPSEIARLSDTATANSGWLAKGATLDKSSWLFSAADSTITSPSIDAGGWHRVFVAFDESGKKGRFHVSVSGKVPQWFESATSVGGETDWQWNFKRVERPSKDMVVTITGNAPGKKLRNLRLYGDKPSWFDAKGNELGVVWDGYELISRTKAVDINFRLRLTSGKTVTVQHRPDTTPTGWRETIQIKGLPKGEKLVLRREGLSRGPRVFGGTPFEKGAWTFIADGEYALGFDLPAEAK